jgi:uncharacterized protein YbaR (Trm112 family)
MENGSVPVLTEPRRFRGSPVTWFRGSGSGVRWYDSVEAMLDEHDFFSEKTEMKPMAHACPQCRHRADYQIKWVKRTKNDRIPSGADERDRALYAKLRDHVYRIDDFVNCARRRPRFEIRHTNR